MKEQVMSQITTADKKTKPGCEVGFKTDPKLDLEIREKLIQARIGLLILHPFYGNLALRLKLVNADSWCPTAATDGKNFFYNTKFVDKLPDGQVLFLFGHELLHCVYDHMGRYDGRNPMLANVAADYCVNGDLVQNKVGTPITVVPILHDHKYYNWSFERVYDDLEENVEKQYVDLDDLVDKMLDEHLESDNGQGDSDGEQEMDENGNPVSKSKPKISEADRQKMKDEMKEAVLNAAQAAGGAGNVPQGIKRLIEQWTQPKLNWREIIQQQCQSTIKSDFTFSRPNRKSWHIDPILPGMDNDEKLEVALCVDMSGSISSTMIRDFFSEIKGISEMYNDFSIKIWTFDTEVYGYKEFDPTNIDELMDYYPQGGGGTDFMCNWKFMEENDIQPKKLIMFTDGYPWGSWGDELYCDTIFLIHGDKSITAPFGMTLHYEEAA